MAALTSLPDRALISANVWQLANSLSTRSACIAGLLMLVTLLVGAGCNHEPTGALTSNVRERWYKTQPMYGKARPAILGDLAYFATGDGQVIAREVSTGAARWSARVGTRAIEGFNIIARDGVVVVPVAFYTVGLDATTGRELWRYSAPNDTTGVAPGAAINPGSVGASRLDADSRTVFISAWGASVSAVDLHSGSVQWIWQPGSLAGDTADSGVFRAGSMSALVSGDTVFAPVWHYVNRLGGTSEAWVVALDRSTGAEFWRVRLPYQGSGVLIEAPPVIQGNLLIVHTLSARTYAIDRATQKIAWEFIAPNPTNSTIAGAELFGNIVYVDGGDQHIYALKASSGEIVWSSAFPTQTTRDLLVTERRIIFTNGGSLYFLDRTTGSQVAVVTQPHTSDPLFASAAAFSGGFVFVTVGGGAWCFEEP
jgi:outer membrane protein assembly factor BamB